MFSDLEDTVRSLSRRLRGLPRQSVQIALPKLQLDRYSVAPDLLHARSVVYSVRTTTSAFFDEALRQHFGCAVHSFEVSSPSTVVDRLQLTMRGLGHFHVDLLRIDLDGAEYAAIDALTRTQLRPCQLVVDFHHHLPDLTLDQTEHALTQLNSLGYRIFDCDASGREVLAGVGVNAVAAIWTQPRARTWCALTASVAAAHGSDRCFASNQHTYLLHAFRLAHPTQLQNDWLATTTDATPVFSRLAAALLTFAARPGLYLAHVLLVAVSVAALAGLVIKVFPRLNTVAGLTLIFSWLIALDAVAPLRRMLLEGVARQAIFGSYLQPSTAGVFILIALLFAARGQATLATVSAGSAAVLHPTYMFSAALIGCVLAADEWRSGRRRSCASVLGSLCLCAAVVGFEVWPIASSAGGAVVAERARAILVFQRIPHHALVGLWLSQRPASVAIQLVLIAGAILLSARPEPRLSRLLGVSAAAACALTLAAALSGDLRLALLFPWRVSTWLVPTSTALVGGAICDRWASAPSLRSYVCLGVATICLSSAILGGAVRHGAVWNEPVPDPALLAGLQSHTTRSDVIVAPIDFEWLRLEAERALVADLKSHPLQPDEVLAWWSRVQLLTQVYDQQQPLDARRAALDRALNLEPQPSKLLLPASDPFAESLPGPTLWKDSRWRLLPLPSQPR